VAPLGEAQSQYKTPHTLLPSSPIYPILVYLSESAPPFPKTKTTCFAFRSQISAMDFHTLSRKELQALSKMNKIPANITNVAMADALSALPHVNLSPFLDLVQFFIF